MASSEKELEEQLTDAGDKLLNPLSSRDELLSLLDKVEFLLSKVEQSPSTSMQDALLPLMKSLIANELLRHSDMDVKVSVASCISEITRITAPDAPYNDEQMKEIFLLTIGAFEKLSHVSSRCYTKAVSILDTVAKVRSCLVMLDLECDALIIEMFQHFLKTIRSNHPHAVFLDMETVMTLVLEESEDISLELLNPLLASVRKENQNVSPTSWKLGEKVIKNCAAKLKPYLQEAVQSMSIDLNDYSQIVASICKNSSGTLEQNHLNGSGEHLTDNKLTERTDSDKPSQVAKGVAPDAICPGEVGTSVDGSSKSAMSNGTSQTRNDDTFVVENPSKNLERCHRNKQPKDTVERTNAKPGNLDSMKSVKSETELETFPKKRGRKPNSLMNPEEGYDPSWIGRGRKALEQPRRRKVHGKEIDGSPSENPASQEAVLPSEHVKDIQPQVFSAKLSHSETISASSASQNHGLPDGSHPKRGRRKKKWSTMNQDATLDSLSVPGEGLLSEVEQKAAQSADVSLKKESEGTRDSEAKPQRRSRKKAFTAKPNGETTPAPGDVVVKKEAEVLSDSEEKPLRQTFMKAHVRNINEEGSSVQQTEGKKRSRGKTTFEKHVTEESGDKKMVSRSATKSSNKDEMDETPRTKSKRKHTPLKEEASEMLPGVNSLDEKLVGCKIRVWWPKDRMFYEGIVHSFDHLKKKHKVLYADGDEEILNLRKQRWELVRDDILPDGGQETDFPSPDASSDMLLKKKAKTRSGSSTKQPKDDSSSKRSGGASDSKSEVAATKSGSKSANDSVLDTLGIVDKSKDDTSKSSDGMKDDGQKSPVKLQTETPKTSTKFEPDSPETLTKSKFESSKGGMKSCANDAAKGKCTSWKVELSEDVDKGKLSDSTDAQENEPKSGKKRRRGLQLRV